jgi:superfamily II DNA helicase RecQ
VLFFSITAIAVQQTVIVVVPFAALVDDIIQRRQQTKIHCEEWQDEHSKQELQQLIIVSANRAISGAFLQFVRRIQQQRQLVHMFFNKCHVAMTDTSYRTRLQQLWQLRYIRYRFTRLTATLMVDLEWVLRNQLSIEGAVLFRRPTARRFIRYRVVDSEGMTVLEKGIEVIQRIGPLNDGARGVIYVRSYQMDEEVSEILDCPFYKATTQNKDEILKR